MQKEFIHTLANHLMSITIAILIAGILCMLVGYQIVAKKLLHKGMKKSDAKAIGQATAVLLLLIFSMIYLKIMLTQ